MAITTTLTPFPKPAPNIQSQSQEEFSANADSAFTHLMQEFPKFNNFASEANATANQVNADAATATTQAGIATRKAGEAATSAAKALASEQKARTSEVNALASKQAALASLNDFKGRWYGALASAPATDPLGNPVNVGDAYFNSTTNQMLVYNGANWMAAATASASDVWYDGSVSGLASPNVQSAIDEVTGALGTAATRDVGTGSGNVMEVGAFGLGIRYDRTMTNPNDFDNLSTGFYSGYVKNATLEDGWPFAGDGDYTMIMHWNSMVGAPALAYTQIFTDIRIGITYIRTGRLDPTGASYPWIPVITSNLVRSTTGQSTNYPMTQKAVTDAINNSAIGVGQSYLDVKASRAVNTVYTNTTGRSIFVSITTNRTTGGSARITVGSTIVCRFFGDSDIPSEGILQAIVPSGASYSLVTSGRSIQDFVELR